jgi:hypothetical protein
MYIPTVCFCFSFRCGGEKDLFNFPTKPFPTHFFQKGFRLLFYCTQALVTWFGQGLIVQLAKSLMIWRPLQGEAERDPIRSRPTFQLFTVLNFFVYLISGVALPG